MSRFCVVEIISIIDGALASRDNRAQNEAKESSQIYVVFITFVNTLSARERLSLSLSLLLLSRIEATNYMRINGPSLVMQPWPGITYRMRERCARESRKLYRSR